MDSICEMDISKEQWKIKTKTAIKKYWSKTLRLEAAEKLTLQYCNISCLGIGQTHPVWDSLEFTWLEVRRGVVKSRIVTGTYIVQSTRAKFNQYQIERKKEKISVVSHTSRSFNSASLIQYY